MCRSQPLRQIARSRSAPMRVVRQDETAGRASHIPWYASFLWITQPTSLTGRHPISRARRSSLVVAGGARRVCCVRELTMSVAKESELKLELTREEMQRVRAHPALGNLAVGEPVTRALRSIYYDTPDYRLRALGISFRLRSDGDNWLQTVKAGTAEDNNAAQPIEAHGAIERPEPDVELIGNRRIRRKITKAVA